MVSVGAVRYLSVKHRIPAPIASSSPKKTPSSDAKPAKAIAVVTGDLGIGQKFMNNEIATSNRRLPPKIDRPLMHRCFQIGTTKGGVCAVFGVS